MRKLQFLFFLLAGVAMAAGCGGSSVTSDGDIETDGDAVDGDFEPAGEGRRIQADAEINFGSVFWGETLTKEFEVFSVGTEAVSVTAVEFQDGEFSWDNRSSFDLPFSLPPGESRIFTFTYAPADQGADQVELLIASNATNAPLLRIALRSEYKGESTLTADPPQVEFGNVPLGEEPRSRTVRLSNDGTGNKLAIIQGIGFERVPETNFSIGYQNEPAFPVYLAPGAEMVFDVTYDPKSATTWPEVHRNNVVVAAVADNADETLKVQVIGTSSFSTLSIDPYPLEFGRVEIGHPKGFDVLVTNHGSVAIRFSGIDTTGSQEFVLDARGNQNATLAAGQSFDIRVAYDPQNVGEDNGELRFMTDLEDSPVVKFSLHGIGREPNLLPVARVALDAHGADLDHPLGVIEGETILFFGEVSYDPDRTNQATNGIAAYAWSLQTPPGSRATMYHPAPSQAEIEFDVGGQYRLTLLVTDEDGAESEPKTVEIEVSGNQSIRISMEYECDGLTDVNLVWISPQGVQCSASTMSATRNCDFGAFGTVHMASWSSACEDGNQEEMVHPDPIDGVYKLQVKYVEDCPCDYTQIAGMLICGPIMCSQMSTSARIKIFLNNAIQPTWTLQAPLGEKGEIRSWSVTMHNGMFEQPVPLP